MSAFVKLITMRPKALSKLGAMLKKQSFTAKEARARGVHPSLLTYYAAHGYIEKLSRGVYRGLEPSRKEVPFEWEDLVAALQSIPRGVICLVSALSIYELTDEMPRQFWIAVPNATRAPRRPQTKIIRMRDVRTGVSRMKLGEVQIKIFDRERTVIDAFRYLSKEIAIKALRRYLEGKKQKPDLQKLVAYSKTLRAPISEYVEAFTT